MSAKRLMRLIATVLVLSGIIFLPCGINVSAYAPYSSYELNEQKKAVAAPIGFALDGEYHETNSDFNAALNAPQDFVVNQDGFFILDSGNSRIVQTDFSLKVSCIYDHFFDSKTGELDFTGATGLAINLDGSFVVADNANCRVLILGRDGLLKKTITRPDSVLQDNDFPFQASKVKCSPDGEIYVTADTMNLGIFVFDQDGNFDKFVAGNPVVKTADVLLNYFYRLFLTTSQIRNRMQSTPLKVANFCMDDDGFLYTVSQNSKITEQTGMVRRLNYRDSNTLDQTIVFGDFERDTDEDKKTLFCSVDVNDNGDIVLLDQGRGRVFYYSKNGYLITVFGGYGDQDGTFTTPVEVRQYDGCIYVLDAGKNQIFKFAPTNYMNTFRTAAVLLNQRDFSASMEKWQEVNRLNSNSEYAYYGMGLIHDLSGDYSGAMKCFKQANNQEGYSNSFKEYRKQFLSQNANRLIAVAVLLIVIICLVVHFVKKTLKKRNGEVYSALETKWLFPFYTIRHPVDGFEQCRTRKIESVGMSVGIIMVWILAELLSVFKTGFIFNYTDFESYNPFSTIIATAGLMSVFIIANWCMATFLEGKGTLRQIICAVSYSMLPYIFAKVIQVVLSNVLCENEKIFISLIGLIGILWTAILIVGSLYAVHQYSFSKTIVSLLLTAVGMFIIIFVIVIFYTLLQQAFGFVGTLYEEATL